MSSIKHIKQAGFTIVELLIVIVVIGILAAITVVSYNGITERARNVSRVNAAKQAQQIVQLALSEVSVTQLRDEMYQGPDLWWRACVGKDYEDIGGYAVGGNYGDCGAFNGSPYVWSSPGVDAILEETASLPSMRSYPPVKSNDGDETMGVYIGSSWVEDSINTLVLEYQLEGEGNDCGLTPLVYKLGGGHNSMTPTGDPKYSGNGDGTTECVVALVEDAW